MSDELKERPIDFDTERPSQSEIDAAVAEITARLKAADAKDARIAELEESKANAIAWAAILDDTINTLQAENQRLRETQRWVPVTEKLPEYEEKVLGVWTDWCNDIEAVRYIESGVWMNADRVEYTAPTHWMPLPDPPVLGGGENGEK